MSSPDDWLTQFDALMDKLQTAAVGFSLVEQQNLHDTLAVMGTLATEYPWSKEQLQHIQARLLSYRELCTFLKNMVKDTLQAATQEGQTSYAPTTHPHSMHSRAIVERYG